MGIEKEILKLLNRNRKAQVNVQALGNAVSSTKCIPNQPRKSINQRERERAPNWNKKNRITKASSGPKRSFIAVLGKQFR